MQKTDKETSSRNPEDIPHPADNPPPQETVLSTRVGKISRDPKRQEVTEEIRSYLITRNYDHIRNASEFSPLVAEEEVNSMDLVRLKKHLQEKFNLPHRYLDNKDEVEEFQETVDSLTDKVLSA